MTFARPSPRQLRWHEKPFYGFVHFGPNTFTDREWGLGDEDPALFAPDALDCRQWARVAREAGMARLILTAKHHDGFCLWPSRWTDHSVARSPWRGGKGDLVREFVEACAEEGIGAGLYLSPWDRHRADYGTRAYTDHYLRQLDELTTGYGELSEIWFDGANGGDGWYGGARGTRRIDQARYYRWDDVAALCRRNQPGAVLFGNDRRADLRWIGNESGKTDGSAWGGFYDDWGREDAEGLRLLRTGLPGGAIWKPAEVDVSIRSEGHWFHHPSDAPIPLDWLVRIWKESVGRGFAFLLNLPPTRRGLFDGADVARLFELRGAVAPFLAPPLAEAAPASSGAPADALALRLPEGRAARAVWIEEDVAQGQRIAAFAVEGRAGPAAPWTERARGETVGRRRLVELPAAAGELRVRVLSALAEPHLSAFRALA